MVLRKDIAMGPIIYLINQPILSFSSKIMVHGTREELYFELV